MALDIRSNRGREMRIESQLVNNDFYKFSLNENDKIEASLFIDKLNAHRFKRMAGLLNTDKPGSGRLGLPFSVERPEAAAAHRDFEERRKSAARSNRNHAALMPCISASDSNGRFLFVVAGILSLMLGAAFTRFVR